ncbi:MAG TPA: HlyD family type I secretion periplasmic adaptor subunit [Burkholderiales bacterium]|nr:HlyD family type I secretion periplasmic adaptor subunit [Burkholderiales bacterium]
MGRVKTWWLRVQPWLVPDLELDEHGDLRNLRRAGLLIILIFIVGIGTWAVFAPLSGAVIAPGVVKVDMNRKTLQHQEGGIVKEILVRDGQKVIAGQSLLVLDDVRVDANLELLRQQHDAELARQARLNAEKTVAAGIDYPESLLARRTDSKVSEVLQHERALFVARRQVLDDQVRLLRDQIAEGHREADALSAQVVAEERAVKLQREELSYNQILAEKNYVQKTRVMMLDRALADYESRAAEHRAERAKTKGRITDIELRIVSARNNYMQTAANEFSESTNRLFDIEERLRPSLDAQTRQRIVAPIDGEVVDLRVFTVGAVIGPRDPLLDIVPLEKTLLVEAPMRVDDVAHVRLGAEVDVRLTAYKQRITPTVMGTVVYISADRLSDKATNEPYYRTHVSITPEALKEAGDLQLLAGMPAEIYIKTSDRSVLDYWMEPITAYLRRAWREN